MVKWIDIVVECVHNFREWEKKGKDFKFSLYFSVMESEGRERRMANKIDKKVSR